MCCRRDGWPGSYVGFFESVGGCKALKRSGSLRPEFFVPRSGNWEASPRKGYLSHDRAPHAERDRSRFGDVTQLAVTR